MLIAKTGGALITKKRKKAFTLIELLAIIVILAIIAVITVPIILNIIENSKKGAATDSAYGYKDAVNKAYIQELAKPNQEGLKLNGTYEVQSDGTLKPATGSTFGIATDNYALPVSVSGDKPSSGSLSYSNNVLTEGWLVIGDYKVEFKSDGTVTTEKNNGSSSNNQSSNNAHNYTVTFNTNGGSEVASQTIAEGGKATRPSDPTQAGYVFDDWYVDNNTFQTLFDFNSAINSNTNVYAKWNENNPYLTTFNGNYTYKDVYNEEYDELDDEWITYLRNDGTKNEVCGVFENGTVCLTSSYYNSNYSLVGNYESDFEDVDADDSYTALNIDSSGLKGYTKAKVDEMLTNGATSCEVGTSTDPFRVKCGNITIYADGYVDSFDGSADIYCNVSENGSAYCS